MIILKATNETLTLTTSSSSGVDVHVSYLDITSLAASGISSQETAISSATTTTVLSAPGSSVQRQVKFITINNKGSAANTVTLSKDIGGTAYRIKIATLSPGESISYNDGVGFEKYTKAGELELAQSSSSFFSSKSYNLLKVGAANEAAGVMHFLGFSNGNPGAWGHSSPGISGRVCDNTDEGALKITNPASGKNYITYFGISASTNSYQMLLDFLWVNSGLNSASTSLQTVDSVEFPARDLDESINGKGVFVGILVSAATTNATTAIANMTYTNSSGTSGRLALIPAFPATAAVGTLVPFTLNAGDSGVKSIQSVTLGSAFGGTIHLVAYRIIGGVPILVANAGGNLLAGSSMNIPLLNNSCILPAYIPTATTATTIVGNIVVEEK